MDVLCCGQASYDLIFAVTHHPDPDEKLVAQGYLGAGGGPAANAAVTVARLGHTAAFAGYLGNDPFGELHLQELRSADVDTRWVVRGSQQTPLSAILVKPDGRRSLVNHRGATALTGDTGDVRATLAKVVLFDGHEPQLSVALLEQAHSRGIPTVLDAGSLHPGTELLMQRVDYLVTSQKFAQQASGETDPRRALAAIQGFAPTVVITLGEQGLVWHHHGATGRMAGYPIGVIDTTGAGDAFHGAFCAGLVEHLGWPELLKFASAAGAFCCTRLGARAGLPTRNQLREFMEAPEHRANAVQ